MYMNLNAFSHGQLQSKQWLCESIEPYISKKSRVAILGSWYNVLGLMMLTRCHQKYQEILGIDIDPDAIEHADKLCEGWTIGKTAKLKNLLGDVNNIKLEGYNVVINCSTEHMENKGWFDNIDFGSLVCLQTSNLDNPDDEWKIINPTYTLGGFKKKYPLSHIIVADTLEIDYDTWGYKRFMLIGIK